MHIMIISSFESAENNHRDTANVNFWCALITVISFFQYNNKDNALTWATEDATRYCVVGDGDKFFRQLGHIPHVQPICHIVAYFISGTGKRAVSNCIPSDAFGQFGKLAEQMDEQIDELVTETKTSEETSWANVGLNIFHAIATIVNAFLWLKRPRPIQLATTDSAGSVVRRARRPSLD